MGLWGSWRGTPKGDLERNSKGDFRGDLTQDLDLEEDLMSSSGQVWFSLQLKFNSLELDSEVGRLICCYF